MPPESREKMEKLHVFVNECIDNLLCYYRNDREGRHSFDLDAKPFFTHTLEEVISLIYPLRRYMNANPAMSILLSSHEEIFFPANEYHVDEKDLLQALTKLEAFMHALGYVVYGDQVMTIGGYQVNCYSGRCVDGTLGRNYIGLGKDTLTPLSEGLLMQRGGTTYKIPSVNGKVGFFDLGNREIFDLVYTVRRFRNGIAHTVADEVENDNRFKNKGRRDTLGIYQIVIVTMLLALDFRYEEIFEKTKAYCPDHPGAGSVKKDTTAIAEQVISGYYLKDVQELQQRVLRNVYRGAVVREEQSERAKEVIDIGVREFRLNDEEEEEGDENDEEEMLSAFELVDDPEAHFLLLGGTSGTGKSTLLARLMIKQAEDWLANLESEQKRLPVRLNLRDFTDPNKGLASYLQDRLTLLNNYTLTSEQSDAMKAYFGRLLEEGRVTICLDGVNEITRSSMNQVINRMLAFVDTYPRCQFILSSRLAEIKECLGLLSRFTIYEMCPLSERQIRKHLERSSRIYTGEDRQGAIWEQINSVDSLRLLAKNPMQLMMLVNILVNDNSGVNLNNLNRGGLYQKFISRLIEWEIEKDQTANITSFSVDIVLKYIGGMMLRFGCEGEREISSQEAMNDLLAEGILGGRENSLTEALNQAKRMGLIDMHSMSIGFTHDSFMEYYEASWFVDQYVRLASDNDSERKRRNLLDAFKMNDLDFEFKKMTFELMEEKDKEVKGQNTSDLVVRMLEKGLRETGGGGMDEYFCWDEKNRSLKVKTDKMPKPNPYLKSLSQITSSLAIPQYSDRKIRVKEEWRGYKSVKPRSVIEFYILNLLYIYKRIYPDGTIPKGEIGALTELFHCAAASGSEVVMKELFTPYWLRMWLIDNTDVRRVLDLPEDAPREGWRKVPAAERSASPLEQRLLSSFLIRNCSDALCLFRYMQNLIEWMSSLSFKQSLQATIKDMLFLYSVMEDKNLKMLHASLVQEKAPYLKPYANWALLMMRDVDFMIKHYDEEAFTTLYPLIVGKLLSQSDNGKVADFLFRRFKNMNEETRIRVIKYFFFHTIYPSGLLQYLWGKKQGNLLLERGILDILPLNRLPVELAYELYDRDIYEYQLAQSFEDDENGIGYFVYDYDERFLRIAIPDIHFECKDKMLKLNSAGGANEFRTAVLGEENVAGYRCTVKLTCCNDQALLPLQGCVRGTDEQGELCQINYLAGMSNVSGLLIYTFNTSDSQMFDYWNRSQAIIQVEGNECKIVHFAIDKRAIYLRLLTVERQPVLPYFQGLTWVYEKGLSKEPLHMDRSLRTPLTYRNELFRPVVFEQLPPDGPISRTSMVYSVYGYRKQSVILWTEPVKTALEGCYCIFQDSEAPFVVAEQTKFNDSFVELTLSGMANADIPLFGTLVRRNADVTDEWNAIPFIYRIVRGHNYILRVDDAEWVKKLTDEDFVHRMIEQESLRIKNQYFHLTAINRYQHNQQSSRITVYSVKQTDWAAIPADGHLFFQKKDSTIPLLLAVGNGMRAFTRSIPKLTYIGDYGKGATLIGNLGLKIANGLYVRLEDHLCAALISEFMVVAQAWQMEIRFAEEVQIPENGWMGFDIIKEVKLRYWIVRKEEGKYSVNVLFGSKYEKLLVKDIIGQATQVTVNDTSYKADEVKPTRQLNEEIKFCLTLSGRELDDSIGSQMRNIQLEYYNPINNKNVGSLFDMITGRLFEVNTVSFHQSPADHHILLIPKSATSVKRLFFKIEGQGKVFPVQIVKLGDKETEGVSDLPLQALRIPDSAEELPLEGFIQFFYDEKGGIPAKVGYDNLSSLVGTNQPEKYHGSVCGLLLQECKKMKRLSSNLARFFIKRNCSAELLDYCLSLPPAVYEEVKDERFNVCIVLSASNSQVALYSPLGRKMIYSEDTSRQYVEDDLVVMEENHRLTPFNGKERYEALGYLEGVVLSVSEEREDAFIHVFNRDDDFYYPFSANSYKPEVGDWVSFFPSINTRKKSQSRPLAKKAMKISSVLRCGFVIQNTVEMHKQRKTWMRKISVRDEKENFISTSYYILSDLPHALLAKVEHINPDDRVMYFLEKKNYAATERSLKCYILI